jgi:hypothetical protein
MKMNILRKVLEAVVQSYNPTVCLRVVSCGLAMLDVEHLA